MSNYRRPDPDPTAASGDTAAANAPANGYQPEADLTLAAAIPRYQARGWSLVRLDPRSKHNRDNDFLTREYPAECFGPADNIGFRPGPMSNRVVDVDLDDPLVVLVAPRFLPAMAPRFGRPKNPGSHVLYRIAGDGPIPTVKFVVEQAHMLAELRAEGSQTMLPPSIHPDTGEKVRWEEDGEPLEVAYDELQRAVGKACLTAVLIARWRDEANKGRHDLMLALAGFLLLAGWTEAEVEDVFRVVHEHACPARLPESLRAITGTAEKIAQQEFVSGEKALRDMLGARVVRNIKGWFPGRLLPWTSGPDEQLTSLGLAQRFARLCEDQARYVPALQQWLVWDGTRWAPDHSHAVDRLMMAVIKGVYTEGVAEPDRQRGQALIKWALANETNANIEAALALAAKLARLQVDAEELDADLTLLNCANGTVDLRTGALRPHDPTDLLTKRVSVPYDPGARCSRWETFLRQVMGEGLLEPERVEERVAYLQRVLGCALSGETVDQLWFYLVGKGRNGKSTILEIVAGILGPDDYSLKVPVEMLLLPKGGGDRHPTDEADVPGRRFVYASEMPKGRHLDVARVKDLTGGDRRATRHMRQDFFRYVPVCTIFTYGNVLPEVKGGDDGFWERLRLLLFEVQFLDNAGGDGEPTKALRKRDRRLREKLEEEREGILAWLVAGCRDWYACGLTEPKDFALAAVNYRKGMDPLDDFFENWCESGPGFSETFKELFAAYQTWATWFAKERYPLNARAFGNELTERGYPRREGTGGKAMRVGLRLSQTGRDAAAEATDGPAWLGGQRSARGAGAWS